MRSYYENNDITSSCADDVDKWRNRLKEIQRNCQLTSSINPDLCFRDFTNGGTAPYTEIVMCDAWGSSQRGFNNPGAAAVFAPRKPEMARFGKFYHFGFQEQCRKVGQAFFHRWARTITYNVTSEQTTIPELFTERSLCFPSSCSTEEVLLMMSRIRPAAIALRSYNITGGTKKISAYGTSGITKIDLGHEIIGLSFESIHTIPPNNEGTNLPALHGFYGFIGFITGICVIISFLKYAGIKLNQYLEPFDLCSNWDSLATMKTNPKAIKSIDGLRVMSITIIAMGHLCNNMIFIPMSNKLEFIETAINWKTMQARVSFGNYRSYFKNLDSISSETQSHDKKQYKFSSRDRIFEFFKTL